MNNGHLSNLFNPTRGLFQGNPAAPLLFLIQVETLAQKLRVHPNIEGIKINEIEYLLSQFADDLSLFLKFKEKTWQAVMHVFDLFEKASGMRVSYEKTTIYRVGSLSNTDAKFYSSRRVKWTNEPITVLGIKVTNERNQFVKINIEPLVEKARQTLLTWRVRGLSLIGKVVVINMLISSLFVYQLAVMPLLTNEIIQQIYQIYQNFIWEDKKAKMKLKILMAHKQEGGLGLNDIEQKDKALKIKWVFRAQEEFKIQNLAMFYLNSLLKDKIWECTLCKRDIEVLFDDSFWRNVLIAWNELRDVSPEGDNVIEKQMLWYNSNIKIGKQVICYKKWAEKGVMYVQDLLTESKDCMTYAEFATAYGIEGSYVKYWGLISAIPKRWFKKLKGEREGEKEIYLRQWAGYQNIVKLSYNVLNSTEEILSMLSQKWERKMELKIEIEELRTVMLQTKRLTNSAKLRLFQFRLLHLPVIYYKYTINVFQD